MKYIKNVIDFNDWDEINNNIIFNKYFNKYIYDYLKEGDIIICDVNYPTILKNVEAKVICKEYGNVLLEFNNNIKGHFGSQKCFCISKNCWWYSNNLFLFIRSIVKK